MFAAKNSCANEVYIYIYTFSRLRFVRLSLVGLRDLHLAFVAILAARYTSSLYEYPLEGKMDHWKSDFTNKVLVRATFVACKWALIRTLYIGHYKELNSPYI